MRINFFNRFFGNDSNPTEKAKRPRCRNLRIESLESRELLSVSAADFAAIKSQYADLNLDDYGDYNIIEITTAELSDAALRTAIATAGNTTANDLIVVRTTATQNKITLGGSELAINFSSSSKGSITIVGYGTESLIIDGNQRSRIFNITNSAEVCLAGLTMTNGKTTGNGGGIYNYGSDNKLIVTKSTISNNSVTNAGSGGGGIYNKSGLVTMTHSTITKNTAICSLSGGGSNSGGGISNFYGIVTVANCVISENTVGNSSSGSSNSGGGIQNYSGNMTLTNSTVSRNSVLGSTAIWGGGIANTASGCMLTITDSEITGNSVTSFSSSGRGGAGGIGNDGTVIVSNSTILGNSVNSAKSSTGVGSGGGISSGSILTVIDSIISKNSISGYSTNRGGGIENGDTTTVTGGMISENSASYGAGIFNEITGMTTLTDCTVMQNNATYGGGIYNDGTGTYRGTVSTINTIISNNTASTGGGIYNNYRGILKLTESSILENSASSGGGIYNYNYATATITDSTVSGNSATGLSGGGGGIYNNSGTITVMNCDVSENVATGTSSGGGGIYINLGSVTLANSMISENSASSGGGIYSNAEYTVTLVSSTVCGNTASNGGGIYCGASGTSFLYNTIVAKNSTDIYRSSGTITGSNNLTTFTGWGAGSTGNLLYDEDLPLFVDDTNGDYQLASDSQAVDVGDNVLAVNAAGNALTTDLAGNARIVGGTVDIGAYEYQTVTTTKLATPTLNNMTATGSDTINVAWNAVSHSDGYRIEFSTDSTFQSSVQIKSIAFGVTSMSLDGLNANTTYYVRIMATGTGEYSDSDYSTSKSATTPSMSEQEKLIACETHAKEIASQIAYYNNAPNLIQGENEIDGQCGDYALLFVLAWNEMYSTDEAKLVIQQQGMDFVPDGIYTVVRKSDIDPQDIPFVRDQGVSGIYLWNGEMGLVHPELGCYVIQLEQLLYVESHFGLSNWENNGPHVWVQVGDVAVDPCYADIPGMPITGTDVVLTPQNKLSQLTIDTVTATGSDTIDVAWSGVANASGYTVEFSTDAAFQSSVQMKSVTSGVTSMSLDGLNANTTYYVRIMATGTGTYSDSDYSATKSTTTDAISLTTPKNLRSISTAQTAFSLQWNQTEGVTEYVLQRKESGDSDFVTIYVGADAKFVDQGLTAGTTYEYRVQAVGSTFSDTVSMTTATSQINGVAATDLPLILSADAQSGNVTITWTDLGSDYTYTVFRAGKIVASSYTSNSYTDTDPLAIAEYAVRAFSRVTQRSSSASVTIAWNTVTPVEFTGYEVVEGSGIKLLWDAQPGMTYQIMRSGRILASNLTSGEWTDMNPLDDNLYVIVASYQEYDADLGRNVTRRTYSNIFSIKKPQNQSAALNILWEVFGSDKTVDELFLNA